MSAMLTRADGDRKSALDPAEAVFAIPEVALLRYTLGSNLSFASELARRPANTGCASRPLAELDRFLQISIRF